MNFTFILVEPAVAENVGSSARALKTMGFERLVVINSQVHLRQEARWLAHGSTDILDSIEEFDTLDAALIDMDLIIGTTAKKRRVHADYYPCRQVPEILDSKATMLENVAVVFGREESGLTNEELKLCHIFTGIPMKTKYPSLNLAQSVMIYAWELSKYGNQLSGAVTEGRNSDSQVHDTSHDNIQSPHSASGNNDIPLSESGSASVKTDIPLSGSGSASASANSDIPLSGSVSASDRSDNPQSESKRSIKGLEKSAFVNPGIQSSKSDHEHSYNESRGSAYGDTNIPLSGSGSASANSDIPLSGSAFGRSDNPQSESKRSTKDPEKPASDRGLDFSESAAKAPSSAKFRHLRKLTGDLLVRIGYEKESAVYPRIMERLEVMGDKDAGLMMSVCSKLEDILSDSGRKNK